MWLLKQIHNSWLLPCCGTVLRNNVVTSVKDDVPNTPSRVVVPKDGRKNGGGGGFFGRQAPSSVGSPGDDVTSPPSSSKNSCLIGPGACCDKKASDDCWWLGTAWEGGTIREGLQGRAIVEGLYGLLDFPSPGPLESLKEDICVVQWEFFIRSKRK